MQDPSEAEHLFGPQFWSVLSRKFKRSANLDSVTFDCLELLFRP